MIRRTVFLVLRLIRGSVVSRLTVELGEVTAFGLQALLSGLVALSGNVRRELNGIDPLLELHGLFHQTRSSRSPDLCGLRGAPEPCG